MGNVIFTTIVASACLALFTSCSATGDTASEPQQTSASSPVKERLYIGGVGVVKPEAYSQSADASEAFGWPWAAVTAEDPPNRLLVLNGNFASSNNPRAALANIQTLTSMFYQEYTKEEPEPIEVPGADAALKQNYSYIRDDEKISGTYIAMCGNEPNTCGMARVSYVGPVDETERTAILDSLVFNPEDASKQPPME